MKTILLSVIFVLCCTLIQAQEVKAISIYNNNLTHTSVKAKITYVGDSITKEVVYYTVFYITGFKPTFVEVYLGESTQEENIMSIKNA